MAYYSSIVQGVERDIRMGALQIHCPRPWHPQISVFFDDNNCPMNAHNRVRAQLQRRLGDQFTESEVYIAVSGACALRDWIIANSFPTASAHIHHIGRAPAPHDQQCAYTFLLRWEGDNA